MKQRIAEGRKRKEWNGMCDFSVQCGACICDNGKLHFPYIRGRIREHVMKLECE